MLVKTPELGDARPVLEGDDNRRLHVRGRGSPSARTVAFHHSEVKAVAEDEAFSCASCARSMKVLTSSAEGGGDRDRRVAETPEWR